MWEFFINIGNWISSHCAEIIAALTSTSTVGLICNIIFTKKQGKNIKDNTAATNTLNENVVVMNDTKTSVDELKASNENLNNTVLNLENKLEEEKIKLDEISNKFTAVLDIMQIVYSTLKDETIRKTVNNIIVDAKFGTTTTKVELEKQVDELKTKLSEGVEQFKEETIAKLEEVKTKSGSKKSKQTVTRY